MKLSVIIPCFNDGQYLKEAVDSVLTYNDNPVEIIIVNDGSTDEHTLAILDQFENKNIKVLSHDNKGLAFSRNRGIQEAKGTYILPLDADNKIRPDYIKKALKLLESGACDIVYAKPCFFGEDIPERKYISRKFDGNELLNYNYIDACAIYRKAVWEKNGGYDEKMPFQGHEDWEFWLNSFISGFRFEYIDEELFDYRINSGSMIANVSNEKNEKNKDYIILKHKTYILDKVHEGIRYKMFHQNDQLNYLRTSLKYFAKFFKNIGRYK